jgi:hypothetical protein
MRACPEAGAGLTGAHQNVVMPTLTGCLLLLPFIPWKFSAAWAGPFAGKPAPTTVTDSWIEAVVGAGSPAKGPALLANLPPPFTVAATTVLAGKPLWWTHIGGWTQAAVGFSRERTRPDRHIKKALQQAPTPTSYCLQGKWKRGVDRGLSGAPLRQSSGQKLLKPLVKAQSKQTTVLP